MKKQEIYHNRNYTYLLISNIINRCGDSLDTILFTWLVYSITNQAGWSAVIFGVNQATSVIIQPFAGPLVEKMDKKMVMVISDCTRALLVFWIFFIYQRGRLSPWVLFFVTIAISLIEAFRMPVGIAVIQHVLPEEHYDKGISINVSFTKIAVLAGTGLSGLVINWLGIGSSLLIDSIIFFVSAFLIIKLEIFIPDHSPVGKGIGREYIISLKDGFTYVFSHKNC